MLKKKKKEINDKNKQKEKEVLLGVNKKLKEIKKKTENQRVII